MWGCERQQLSNAVRSCPSKLVRHGQLVRRWPAPFMAREAGATTWGCEGGSSCWVLAQGVVHFWSSGCSRVGCLGVEAPCWHSSCCDPGLDGTAGAY